MASTLAGTVAGQVRAEMARSRVSGMKLASQLGRSNAYLSRRLNGKVPLDLQDLERIAEVLDVPVARLLPAEVRAQ